MRGDLPRNEIQAVKFHRVGVEQAAPQEHFIENTLAERGEMAQLNARAGSKSQRRVKRRKPAQVIARRLASRGFSDHVPEQNGVKHDLEWPAAENPRQPVQQSHARDEAEFIYLRPVLSAGRRNGRIHRGLHRRAISAGERANMPKNKVACRREMSKLSSQPRKCETPSLG